MERAPGGDPGGLREVGALLEKAERSFAAADLLLDAGDADFAVSRAYYGWFYVAEALLLSEGLRYSRHGQVISQYGQRFAATDRLDRRFHRLLGRAFELRQLPQTTRSRRSSKPRALSTR